MTIGAGLVVETVKGLYNGKLKPVPQSAEPGAILHTAPKILPSDTLIDWKEPATRIHNKIRGLSPLPGAATTLTSEKRTLRLKIFESRIDSEGAAATHGRQAQPGIITVREKSRLFFTCGSGEVEIISLQPEGRKRMTTAEFIRGFDLTGWVAV
jgi:methionyl-tRNA formyltransferase